MSKLIALTKEIPIYSVIHAFLGNIIPAPYLYIDLIVPACIPFQIVYSLTSSNRLTASLTVYSFLSLITSVPFMIKNICAFLYTMLFR